RNPLLQPALRPHGARRERASRAGEMPSRPRTGPPVREGLYSLVYSRGAGRAVRPKLKLSFRASRVLERRRVLGRGNTPLGRNERPCSKTPALVAPAANFYKLGPVERGVRLSKHDGH